MTENTFSWESLIEANINELASDPISIGKIISESSDNPEVFEGILLSGPSSINGVKHNWQYQLSSLDDWKDLASQESEDSIAKNHATQIFLDKEEVMEELVAEGGIETSRRRAGTTCLPAVTADGSGAQPSRLRRY